MVDQAAAQSAAAGRQTTPSEADTFRRPLAALEALSSALTATLPPAPAKDRDLGFCRRPLTLCAGATWRSPKCLGVQFPGEPDRAAPLEVCFGGGPQK